MIAFVTEIKIKIKHLLLKRTETSILVEVNTDRGALGNNRNVLVGSPFETPLEQHLANSVALRIRRYIHSIEFPALLEITRI
jgi:hypothetical protein